MERMLSAGMLTACLQQEQPCVDGDVTVHAAATIRVPAEDMYAHVHVRYRPCSMLLQMLCQRAMSNSNGMNRMLKAGMLKACLQQVQP